MLSKIAFISILYSCLLEIGAMNPLSLTETSANPIETMFGNGYICLHITDPIFDSSPSFQALAVELAKRYNKTAIIHKIGSNETDFPHTQAPETVHYEIVTTPAPPGMSSLLKRKAIKLKCEKEGYFGNPNNCTKFFRCVAQKVRGKPWKIIEFDCAPGTVFNKKTKLCDFPHLVDPIPDCELQESGVKGMRGFDDDFDDETTTPPPEQLKEGTPQLPDVSDTESPPEQPLVDEGVIEQAPIHECEMSGLFPDDNDCHSYHQCVKSDSGFKMFTRICEEKLIFDPKEEECRRPEEIEPKPECWKRRRHTKRVKTTTNETIITEVYEKPDSQEATEPPTESPPESQEIVGPEDGEEPEFFDEFDSQGKTQMVKTPTIIHKTNITKTTVEETIDIEQGGTVPSVDLHGKKRKTIPRPNGPKPIPQCDMEGTFAHSTECNMYMKCVKRGKAFKIYFFSCVPEGTVFDDTTKKCVDPQLISIPPIPECAHWDDIYHPIFEDILNEEVDEETTTALPEGPVDPLPEGYEEHVVTDENGKKHIVRTKKVITEDETSVDIIEGDKIPTTPLEGHHTAHKPTDTPDIIDDPSPGTDDYSQVVETKTEEPTTASPTPVLAESYTKPEVEDSDKLPCEDEVEYVKKLTLERDEALQKITELEKQRTKMETQIKKMQKDLGAAKKDATKYKNYIVNLDKTIESYKDEVNWYLQHCPQPTEFVEDDEEGSNPRKTKSRKRRSLDTSVTPVVAKPSRRMRDDDHFQEIDADLTSKRHRVKQFREAKPRPVHITSESVVTEDREFRQSPFSMYDQSGEESISELEETFENHRPHHGRSPGQGRGHGSHGHSVWTPESDGSFFLSQIPLLIFTVLAIVLITITLLGCLVVRRLNRMTTFSVTSEDSDSYSPASTYRRKGRRFGSADKLRQV